LRGRALLATLTGVIKLSDRPRRRPDIAAQPLDSGAVLVDLTGGRCFELNRVGSEIWTRLDGTATLAEIREELRARYAIDVDVLDRDLLELGASLLASNLIVLEPSTAAGPPP
jgi:Coenzyme PQQ synthesis protein D (PqqD)